MGSNRGGLWPAIVRLLDLRAVDKSFRRALRGGMTAEKFDRQRQPLLKRQQLSLARVATDGVFNVRSRFRERERDCERLFNCFFEFVFDICFE